MVTAWTAAEARADFLRAVERARTGRQIDPKEELDIAASRARSRGWNQSSMRVRAVKEAARKEAAAKKAREEAARRELEKARQAALVREAAQKEAARRSLNQALERARAKKSLTARARAREDFTRAIEASRKQKQRFMITSNENFKKSTKKTSPQELKRLSHKEQQDWLDEQRVLLLEKQRGKDVKLSERLEKARRRLEERAEKIIKEKEDIEKAFNVSTEGKKLQKGFSNLIEGFWQTKTGKVFNVATGGSLETSRINRRERNLNKKIETFNKQFGDRGLSETQFKIANELKQEIDKESKNIIKDRDKSVESFRSGVKGFFFGSKFKSTSAERNKAINKFEQVIETNENKLKETGLSSVKRNLLTGQISGANKEITRLKGGGDVTQLRTGTVPLALTAGIPANANVVFAGTQKAKGNKIITDIVFTVGKKRVGMARGVTIIKGSKGTSVVLGKSGISGTRFPSGRRALIRKRVFAGVERSRVSPSVFKLKSPLKTPRGKLTLIRRNIQGLKQAGVGKVATVKGERFFHTGIKLPSGKLVTKKVPRINVNDFASFSAAITRKDLSLIVGKAITTKQAKINFIGLIKGTARAGKTFTLSGTQKLQYKKALQNVISVASASLAKADKLKGLTNVQRIAASTQFARQIIASKPTLKATITGRTVQEIKPSIKPSVSPTIQKMVVKPKTKPLVISKAKVKQGVAQLSRQQQQVKQKLRQVTKQRQRVKQKAAQKTLQQQQQKLKMRLKTLIVQKSVLAGIHIKPTIIPTPKQMRILLLATGKRKKVAKPKIKPERFQGYNVYGKHKKKFIKLNVKPLSKSQALDRGAFAIDHSTANTFKIEGVGKIKKLGKLTKGELGHFSKTQKKYRSYRIQKGKRIVLKDKHIEKRGKPRIDTRGEKRGLTLARLAKQRGFTGTRTPVRRKPVSRKTTTRMPVRNSPIRKPQPKKRQATSAQLEALTNGRKILAERKKK